MASRRLPWMQSAASPMTAALFSDLQRVPDPASRGFFRVCSVPTGSSSSYRATSGSTSRTPTRSSRGCAAGQQLVIPIKHGEGAWYADEETFVQLAARNQIVLRYDEDVNGSLGNVAGVINERGNVMGLMPHPEHVDPLLGSADGGLLEARRRGSPAPAREDMTY